MIVRYDLSTMSPEEVTRLTRRQAVPAMVMESATEIVNRVRREGDSAMVHFDAVHGGGCGTQVPAAALALALASLPPRLRNALDAAVANVTAVHAAQLPVRSSVVPTPGVVVERIWAPLRRIGAYVPGGSAPLPSTLIMTVVPAVVAGVPEIVVATPAAAASSLPDPTVLAAAALLGVTDVRVMGGAQAIAAMAFGTASLQPVQKIVGPGNGWVAAAKVVVSATVAIDMPAGPSEALILADAAADPRFVAADLLAQAEHGPDSVVVLVTADRDIANSVAAEVGRLLPLLGRGEIVSKALADHGAIVVAESTPAAIEFAQAFAPEHLSVHLQDPEVAVVGVTSAGSVFVGPWAPEPVGDYASGANHVLPTGGLAAAMGPLGTEDFGSWRQVQRIDKAGLERLRPIVASLADAEGLDAHRLAVDMRFET